MGNALRLGISKIGLAWTKRRMKTTIRRNPISLLIIGSQATGKTTIALRLWKYKRNLPDLNYVQTKGFNTYSVARNKKSTINLYDLGGHPSIQELWDHYYADAHGVIFVVDVSDQTSLSEAGVIFEKVLNDDRIRGKPILLLANKQDLGGASEVELDSVMNLQEVVNSARCLTRLEESTATDLKNDKGIFDGFKWLVEHIENHYHELNDRVIHDVLEEKNREKARRAAIREEMERDAELSDVHSPAKRQTTDNSRPSSQRSLGSGKLFHRNPNQNVHPPSSPSFVTTANAHVNANVNANDEAPNPNLTTNYLIKTRPNSSSGDGYNPFAVRRAVSTAPSTGRRRISLPYIGSFVKGADKIVNPFLVKEGNQELEEELVNCKTGEERRDSENTISTSGMNTAAGRLSPEGADSDEGIVNPAFEDETDNITDSKATTNNHGIEDKEPEATPPLDITTDFKLPIISPTNELRKLVRTESSDTERAGEILMVTTLVQVHQDEMSKDRRGSTTSTRDSIALSLTSFKSEDNSSATNPDYYSHSNLVWDSQSLADGQQTPGASSSSPPAPASDSVINTTSIKSFVSVNESPPRRKGTAKEMTGTGIRKPVIRIGKNKTAPYTPAAATAMVISSMERQKQQALLLTSNSTRVKEKDYGSNANSNTTTGKNRLKNKNQSGFSSGDSQEGNIQSQFVRQPTLSQIERLKKY